MAKHCGSKREPKRRFIAVIEGIPKTHVYPKKKLSGRRNSPLLLIRLSTEKKEGKIMNERELEILAMDLLCAPTPTDDLEDIDFDDAGGEKMEQDFIQGWLREERAYNERIRITEETEEPEQMEERHE
jgi:hypothetical protein